MTERRCPICAKAITAEAPAQSAPFCSPRCKDVDLHRWLSGAYAIPAVEQDDPDAEDFARDPTLH